MQEQLILSAKEIGFSSDIISDKPWKHSAKEDLRYLFWMANLQKWLREVHGLEVIVKSWKQGKNVFLYSVNKLHQPSSYYNQNNFETHEQALEVGLTEALKLIK